MPKQSKSKSRSAAKLADAKPKSKPTFKWCPWTGEKVWITTVTLAEIKRAQRTGECPSSKKKQLVRIPSKAQREAVLQEAADAIAAREALLLQDYGGRPWTVTCKFTCPTNQKPPLFRWFRGQLELACLPHFLEKIPDPPRRKGRALAEYDSDSEEYVPTTALQERAVSALSELTWTDGEYAIPSLTIKWKSPNCVLFHSRKAAFEHRDLLMEQTLWLDRILCGYGARGQALKPFKPTKAQSLKAGSLRFLRDGLWVVGQEEAWQEERREELIAEAERKKSIIEAIGSKCQDVEHVGSTEKKEPPKKKQLTPLQFYLLSQREEYRQAQLREMSIMTSSTSTEATADATAAGTSPPTMTLRQAEQELRNIWKTLSEEEQREYKVGAAQFNQQEMGEVPVTETADEESKVVVTTDATHLGIPASVPTSVDTASKSNPPELEEQSATSSSEKAGIMVPMKPISDGERAVLNPESVDQAKAKDETAPPTGAPTNSIAVTASEEDHRLVSPSPPTGPVSEDEASRGHQTKEESTKQAPVLAIAPTVNVKKRRPPSACPPRKIQPSSHWRLKPDQMDLCYTAAIEHYDKVMATVRARGLLHELQDGFDVFRERGRGRFDMELPVFDEPRFSFLTDIRLAPWMPIVRQILGEDVVLIHKGVFLSMPDAESQIYHQDGPHLNTKIQKPCHAVNVFIPLVDLTSRNGPTEFCLGTHYHGHDEYDKTRVETPTVPAGTPVIFDYRLGHRGLANTSSACRPIVYCTYAAAVNGKEFRDSVNFSRKRYHKIGELVEKPLSREERAKRRKRSIEEQRRSAEEAVHEETEANTVGKQAEVQNRPTEDAVIEANSPETVVPVQNRPAEVAVETKSTENQAQAQMQSGSTEHAVIKRTETKATEDIAQEQKRPSEIGAKRAETEAAEDLSQLQNKPGENTAHEKVEANVQVAHQQQSFYPPSLAALSNLDPVMTQQVMPTMEQLSQRSACDQQRILAPRQQMAHPMQHPLSYQPSPALANLDPLLLQQALSLTGEQISGLPPSDQQRILALRRQFQGGT